MMVGDDEVHAEAMGGFGRGEGSDSISTLMMSRMPAAAARSTTSSRIS